MLTANKQTQLAALVRLKSMPTSNELPLNGISASTRSTRLDATLDELSQIKRQLLQAEVRLAKARAHAAGAEADVKLLSTRLRAISK